MKTTLAAIVVWALATIALCAVGIVATGKAMHRQGSGQQDPMKQLVLMLAEDASAVYESGGAAALAAHLEHLDEHLPGRRFLVDGDGKNVIDGSDFSAVLAPAGSGTFELCTQPDGTLGSVVRVREGGRRFVWLVEPWFEMPNPWPFVGTVVAIIAAMASGLALWVSVPLRRLRSVMDRFGKGELAARVGSRRSDDIGIVSRAFDTLADRVETLVTAERRLLSDVSHELAAPLTRLDLALGLATTRDDPAPFIERSRREQRRLAELVSELLHLTRAEGDPTSRVRSEVGVRDLLTTLVEEVTIEAEEKGCDVRLDLAWSGPLRGDGELLRRAIENVIRNSVRHAPPRTVIDVSLTADATAASIQVRDRGAGAPEDQLESIFEPFFRVGDDRSRDSGGVGLGLAIARRAVAIHGGRIRARNADPGLAVEIVLPLHAATG